MGICVAILTKVNQKKITNTKALAVIHIKKRGVGVLKPFNLLFIKDARAQQLETSLSFFIIGILFSFSRRERVTFLMNTQFSNLIKIRSSRFLRATPKPTINIRPDALSPALRRNIQW